MRIIQLVTKTTNGYRNWDRFRNRCMLILEKGIDFEIDKNDGSIKIIVSVKFKGGTNKLLTNI